LNFVQKVRSFNNPVPVLKFAIIIGTVMATVPLQPASERLRLVISEAIDIGDKPTQEDRYFWTESLPHFPHIAYFGVYDGHGGQTCSEWARENMHNIVDTVLFQRNEADPLNADAITQAFLQADDTFIKALMKVTYSGTEISAFFGSTVCVMLVNKSSGKVLVANLGDTRAIMKRDGKALQLSVDHKTTVPEETARIEKSGHTVENKRIDGIIAIARALGDCNFKRDEGKKVDEQPIIPIPSVNTFTLDKSRDEFLMIGTDGIYEGLENDEIIDFINTQKQDPAFNVSSLARKLLEKGLEIGCYDNMTVILLFPSWVG